MAKVQRMWEPWEVAYLEEFTQQRPIIKIASYLKRSPMSVRHKCYQLGLERLTELDYFTTGYIAKMLDCTSSAIAKRIANGDIKVKKKKGGNAYVSRAAFREFWEGHKTARLFKGVDPEKLNWLLYG